jgi:invasion protein IalB
MRLKILLISLVMVATFTGIGAHDLKAEENKPEGQLWTKQCVKGPEGKEACFIQQFAISVPDNTALLKVVFSYLGPKGGPRLEVTTPLGVFLQPGVVLTIKGHAPLTLPFTICHAGGCQTVVDLDKQSLNQFIKGKEATVRYMQEGPKVRELPMKLMGLASALQSLQ